MKEGIFVRVLWTYTAGTTNKQHNLYRQDLQVLISCSQPVFRQLTIVTVISPCLLKKVNNIVRNSPAIDLFVLSFTA